MSQISQQNEKREVKLVANAIAFSITHVTTYLPILALHPFRLICAFYCFASHSFHAMDVLVPRCLFGLSHGTL